MLNTTAPCKPLPIKPPLVRCETRPDGSVLMRQERGLQEGARSVVDLLARNALKHPNRTWIAKRESVGPSQWGDWVKTSYGEAWQGVCSIAQYLLDLELQTRGRSVWILTGPSAAHAMVAFGAMLASVPVTASTPAYAIDNPDVDRLGHVCGLIQPGLILVDGIERYERALSQLAIEDAVIVDMSTSATRSSRLGNKYSCVALTEVLETRATTDVDGARAALEGDAPAIYMFTSGSTGHPKAAVHTHRTLTAQIRSRDALLVEGCIEDGVARMSWLPWNHIAGVIQLHYSVADAGSYYIDEGRPVQGGFEETLRNLREVIPSEFTSTPILYERLVDALERDARLRHRFFRTVRYMTYATAPISDDLIDRIQAMARAEIGENLPFCAKYGTTETNPALHSARPLRRAGELGIPYPGVTIKLVPHADRYELRVKGEMVFKGYLNDPQATAEAFDDEGYFRTGDGVSFINAEDPAEGLMFAGRISENFKLSSGTWVTVGQLRTALIEALSPLLFDAVITGHGQTAVAALAWLRPEAAAEFCGQSPGTPVATLVDAPEIRAYLARKLHAYNKSAGGSARRVSGVLLLAEPPRRGEITDKGYINQRQALRNREKDVQRLYAQPADSRVIRPLET